MLSRQQKDTYEEKGFLVVEDVLSVDEVLALREVTDYFVEQSRTVTEHTDVFDLEPEHTPEEPRLRRLKAPVEQHQVYRDIMNHDGILDIVEELIGPGVRTNGRQAQHEVAAFWQSHRMAPGLGLLSPYQRRPAGRGGLHGRHAGGKRLHAVHSRFPSGADS